MIDSRKTFRFTGTHADQVKKLCRRQNDIDPSLFRNFYNVLLIAPIIGLLYGRKSKKNEDNDSYIQINAEQMIAQEEELNYVIKLVLLMDNNYLGSKDERIEHLFRYTEFNEEEYEIFESYLYGGIEFLYEKLIEEAEKNGLSYLDSLDEFIHDYDDKFNKGLTNQEIIEVCNQFIKK